MIKLYSRKNLTSGKITLSEPQIALITSNIELPPAARKDKILILKREVDSVPRGFLLALSTVPQNIESENLVILSQDLCYLDDKDIIKYNPNQNSIQVLYRFKANANSFLITERCNSFCIMCSQPPRKIDDGYLVGEILKAIPLVDQSTTEIGFTGGEPTLIKEKLFDLIRACKQHLPFTALHILSNGRNFKDLNLAIEAAKVNHHNLMWGIPLYSDVSQIHDFVVQADDAFDETIRGIINLKRCMQRVEIRVVIHKQTYERLPKLAEFISRNLTFVDHVALMGLENMGFTKANRDALWIDPYFYQDQLEEAVNILKRNRINTSIYNHQLCILPEGVRDFAVKSISDWKNEYISECSSCSVMNECGGFFSSTTDAHSSYIKPLR